MRLRTPEERAQFLQWLREEGFEGSVDPVEALFLRGEGEEARAEPIEGDVVSSAVFDHSSTVKRREETTPDAASTEDGPEKTDTLLDNEAHEGDGVRDEEDASS